MKHADYMSVALTLAYSRFGKTSPNPAVGAVIVKDGKIISAGATGRYGEAHAEASAINKALQAGEDLSGADIYVSLEPCCHYGKTPPCTEAILRSGIGRVFVPAVDPNPLVAGQGIARLKACGIKVVFLQECEQKALDLIRPFKKYILSSKPFILHKSALTLDGKTAASSGDSKWISSPASRYIVHRLRSIADGVIVGKNTVAADNPSLTARFGDFDFDLRDSSGLKTAFWGRENFLLNRLICGREPEQRQPLRIGAGLSENFSPAYNFFADDNYLLFETKENYEKLLKQVPEKKDFFNGLNIVLLKSKSYEQNVNDMMNEMHKRGIMFAVLEGGSRLAGAFFNSGNIDQFLYFIAPKIAGNGAPPMQGKDIMSISDALKLKDMSFAFASDDIIACGYSDSGKI